MNETVIGEKGMVVAPHSAAAEAGAEAMRAGGNALEAIIAAAATIAVVYPHMNGIGGDAFFLIAEPGKKPRAIDACGAAGSLATIERYEKAGYDVVPPRGVYGALTVPGAVSGWVLALEFAAALGGRLALRDLLGKAIATAKEGSPVPRSQARMTAENLDDLRDVPGWAARFLIDGKPPETGARFVQERLADTLEHIARAGLEDFYRGDVAAEIAADLEQIGGLVTREDLRRQRAPPGHAALDRDPRGHPLQPAAADPGPRLADPPRPVRPARREARGKLRPHSRPDRIGQAGGGGARPRGHRSRLCRRHRALPASRLARRRGRSASTGAASRRWRRRRQTAIRSGWARSTPTASPCPSFSRSIWEFGSGVVLPRTGITLQNRGSSFSLDPKSRNPLTPGRKPFHTLNPPLARFRDGRVMTYGSMGGDGQPQFQAQIFTRYLFGMDPGDAVDAPRFRVGTTWGRQKTELLVENRFDTDLLDELERAGHPVTVSESAYLDGMGHAGMIVRRPDGRLLGGADPRADGAAVAV